MYRIKIRSRLQINKAGFTLIELIVAIAIMLILAGGAVVGFTKILSNSKYQQQCDTAKSLYIAAQNQLTEWKSTGTLEKFSDELKNSSGSFLRVLDVTKLTDLDGNYYTDIWNTAQKSVNGTTTDLPGGTIVYLSCKPGEYFAYKQNPGSFSNLTGQAQLFKLLESYLYDTSLLDAAISVELCPETGVVFSVCYSSEAEGFSYYDAVTGLFAELNPLVTNAEELAKYTSICNRENEYCRRNKFGYYGVDKLSMETNYARDMQNATKPVLASVTLNNEDTLNLSFKEIKCNAISWLTYHIKVYEKSNPATEIISLTFDGSQVMNLENKCLINATEEITGTQYKLMAWLDTDNAMHVVLDAVDYDQKVFDDAEPANDKDNMSFQRFGVDAENIFCTVFGTSTSYKSTNVKQSNTESVYFETAEQAENVNGGQNYSYTLANARHLFNIRNISARYLGAFPGRGISAYSDRDKVSFELKNDIDWENFAANSGQVYFATMLPAVDAWTFNKEFLSIESIPRNTTLDGKNKCITGLNISESANKTYGLNYNDNGATGLVMVNNGTLKNLKLDGISGFGDSKVGAFCGINAGTVENLTVLNTDNKSYVKGNSYVGGIFGYLEVASNALIASGCIEVSGCENRAAVEGTMYVGGIVGSVEVTESSANTVYIHDCNNYGRLTAITPDADKTKAKYIGGITGCAVNHNKSDTNRLRIVGCNSSPQYTAAELDSIFATLDKTALESRLNGVYVGGIAGYSSYAAISNCSTKSERTAGGYILGYEYVGGIVGFHEGPANSSIDGNTGSTRGVNEASVIGVKYVGGITGCSSVVKTKNNDIVEPDTRMSPSVRLSNWVNRGFVYATEEFAGGISGYNTGWINNCNSEVRANAVPAIFTTDYAYTGNCVGGIAGYNAGIIGNTSRAEGNYEINDGRTAAARALALTCYVTGKNYVGGVVGYNDAGGIIEDYQVSGGYVRANQDESYFTGGYVGYNASIYMMMSTDNQALEITSNPNEVTGKYFVGGIIGGNLINTEKVAPQDNVLKAHFMTNNFLGEVNGTEFVGGFIGYNLLYKDAQSVYSWEQTIDKRLIAKVQNAGGNYLNNILRLERFVDEDSAIAECSDITFLVEQGTGANGSNRFGRITAQLYVGGVIGYCDPGVHLTLKNIVNTTPVTAKTAIQNNAEQSGRTTDYEGENKVYSYSYAGGIIGKITKNTVLDACANARTATITAKVATYMGSLCEINEGTIQNCAIDSVGSSTALYIGGLCGLNKAGATITGCKSADKAKTITGKNMVGGIVAENFGTISDISVDAPVLMRVYGGGGTTGTHGVTGFFAAHNGESGTIIVNNDISGISIDSSGDYVGGVVGINNGKVENGLSYAKNTAAERRSIDGNIQGRSIVGGIIGQNTSMEQERLYYFCNKASVTAKYGNAGGILGQSSNAGFTISYCENKCSGSNKITASVSGDAGGICAVNLGKIEYCYNYSVVEAPSGKCGGICAVNGSNGNSIAKIVHCFVNDKATNTTLTFASKKSVGGIVAENYAVMEGCKLYNVTVINYTTSGASDIGVVVGVNYPTGTIKVTGSDLGEKCKARTYTNNSNVGGIAGRNQGRIFGMDLKKDDAGRLYPQTLVYSDVTFEGTNANTANMGGVVGLNEGRVENISVVAEKIVGNLGSSDTGCGGICGRSVDSGVYTANPVGIWECTFDGGITAQGANSAIARIGGITGINGEESTVYNCIVGRFPDKNTTITGLVYAYVGGECGENFGDIVAGDNHVMSQNLSVTISAQAGNIGGIVGVSREYAAVYGKSESEVLSTGDKWKVITGKCEEYGGIIGFCYSASEIKWVSNHAKVSGDGESSAQNPSAGGLVGRIEFTYTSQIKITNCENKGEVYGRWRVGGIVGTIKSAGGYFKNCTNSGTINGGNSIGGILGNVRDMNHSITFHGCANHGYISAGQDSGGILGRYESTTYPREVNFIDCANTGEFRTSTSTGGIAGRINKNYNLVNCRNYSTSTINSMLGGVDDNNGNTGVMINCLDAGLKNQEFIQDSNSTYAYNNYKLGYATSDSGMYFDCTYSGTTPDSNSYTAKEIFDNTLTKDFTVGEGGELTLYIDVEDIRGLKSFSILLEAYENRWWGWDEINSYTFTMQTYLTDGTTREVSEAAHWYEYNAKVYGLVCASVPDVYDERVSQIVFKIKPTNGHVVIAGMRWSDTWTYGYSELNDCQYKAYWYSNAGMVLLSGESASKYNLYASRGDSHATDYRLDISPYKTDHYSTRENFGKLDNLYQSFLWNCYNPGYKLLAPENCAVEIDNSECTFSWERVDAAYGYDVYYELLNHGVYTGKQSDTTFVMGMNKLSVNRDDIAELADGTAYTHIRFYVRAVNAYEYIYAADASMTIEQKRSFSSDFVSHESDMQKKILPTPSVHIEITPDNNAVLVIANYKDYKKDIIGTEEYLNCLVNVNIGNSVTKQIKVAEGNCSEKFSLTGIDLHSDYSFTIFAEPYGEDTKAGYLPSGVYTSTGLLIGNDNLSSPEEIIRVKSEHFAGISEEDLSYKTVLSARDTNLFVRSDLLVYDEDLGIYVAHASETGEIRARFNNNYTTDTTLSIDRNLASMVGKNIFVRKYLDASAGRMVQMGHEVADSISLEGLKAYLDVKDTDHLDSNSLDPTNKKIVDNNGKLRDGYVVALNADDTYHIFYNATLAFQNSHVYMKVFMYDSERDCYTTSENETLYVQPKPVVEENYDTSFENGHYAYTFTWDKDMDYTQALYSAQLFGTNISGDTVLLKSVPVISERSYRFVDDQDNWNYNKLKLRVVRLGEQTPNGVTTHLPRSEEKSFSLKNKLDAISTPQISLVRIDGAFNTDELDYEIIWNAITDANEVADLGGYMIKAEVIGNEDDDISRVGQILYYYVLEQEDCGLEDFFENGVLPEYYKNITDTFSWVENSTTQRRAVMNLSAFHEKDVLAISVRALARRDIAGDEAAGITPVIRNYTHGSYGDSANQTIPSRLATPDIRLLTSSVENMQQPTLVSIMNGTRMEFTWNDPNYVRTEGSYYIAVDLVSPTDTALGGAPMDNTQTVYGSNVPSTLDFVHPQNTISLVKREDKVRMTEQGMADRIWLGYSIDFNTLPDIRLSDYAGWWVRVSLKKHSENAISSMWTDEDDSMVSYYVAQLPNAKIDAPSATAGNGTIWYYNTLNKVWYDTNDANESMQHVAKCRNVVIHTDAYAVGYEITIAARDGRQIVLKLVQGATDATQYHVYTKVAGTGETDESAHWVLIGTIGGTGENGLLNTNKLDLSCLYSVTFDFAELGLSNIEIDDGNEGETEIGSEAEGETEIGSEAEGETETGNEVEGETETGNEVEDETETGNEVEGETETGNEVEGETETGNEVEGGTGTGSGRDEVTLGSYISVMADSVTGEISFVIGVPDVSGYGTNGSISADVTSGAYDFTKSITITAFPAENTAYTASDANVFPIHTAQLYTCRLVADKTRIRFHQLIMMAMETIFRYQQFFCII